MAVQKIMRSVVQKKKERNIQEEKNEKIQKKIHQLNFIEECTRYSNFDL